MFGSDDEEVDEEAEKLKQQRLAEYAAKKANKPKTIAKSVVTLDVKPWDDETDMAALEAGVRSIHWPGLVWGLSKLVPVGYGVKKLQMTVVIEDELVSLDDLQDKIAEDEDHVQSSDVAAMQVSSSALSNSFYLCTDLGQRVSRNSKLPRRFLSFCCTSRLRLCCRRLCGTRMSRPMLFIPSIPTSITMRELGLSEGAQACSQR